MRTATSSILKLIEYSNSHTVLITPNFILRVFILNIYLHIQGDSGGICTTLGNDSMSDSKQKSSYEHGSDF
jgi:hypothetical protein